MSDQTTVWEAEALAALERAKGSAGAAEVAVRDASYSLQKIEGPFAKSAEKLLELLRLTSARLATLARQVGEGDE